MMDAAVTSYLVLMRGINVGGKNLIPMAGLRQVLEALGFAGVATYLQSGNAVVQSELAAEAVASRIEAALPAAFRLDSALIKVLVLSQAQLQAVIDDRPKGFGDTPDLYHSDAIFLMGLGMAEALAAFSPREGVDTIWPGKGIIYSQRLSALRTKSRLNRMMANPLYLSMTIRSWGTVLTLVEMMRS